MKLSIVSTLYYSESYIEEFCKRIVKVIPVEFSEFEIILVDDGSPDSSINMALEIQKEIQQIRIVELSRNFGHHKAMLTGIGIADGDFIFSIDIDLEEKPELLESFWSEYLKDKSVDLLYGVANQRKGGYFEKNSGFFFYKILNKISGVKIPENTLMAKLMTRQFSKELLRFRDKNVFLGGIMILTGFNQKPVECDKNHKGSTTYSLHLKLSQAINSIASLSSKPLYIISYIGILLSLFSVIYIIYLIINKLFFSSPISGWTSTMISIYFIGGIILSSVGIVGLYISKIFEEVKDRPYTIIKKIWDNK